MKRLSMTLVAVAASALAAAASAEDDARRQAIRHYRVGQEALQTEAWAAAESEFRAAIRLDPLLTAAHYGLGQVYMATKRYGDAVKAYGGCRDAFRAEEADRLMSQTVRERRLQDQIRALEDSIRALQTGRVRTTNPSSSIIRLEDQVRDLKRRRLPGSAGPLPTPPGVSLALGSALFRTEAFAEAEREYRAALEVDPGLGEAHNNLGVVCMVTGRLEEAERELKLAEESGFPVSPGLKQDLRKRREAPR